MRRSERARFVFPLLFLEAAALLHGVSCLVRFDAAAKYALSNEGAPGLRAWLGAVPLLCGGALVATLYVLHRRRPALLPSLSVWARRAAPLLALWPLPLLLRRDAFGGQPLFLCLVLLACVVGLEASLRFAGPLPWCERLGRWRTSSSLARLAPLLVAGGAILATFVFGYTHAVRVHQKLLTSNFDFGLFENLFYNALHGRHGIALAAPYFSQHAEFLLYVLLPFYALVPRSETLFFLQSLLIVGAAVPLYLLARRWLASAWAACALVVIYVSSPAVHGPLLFDFHFLPLSAFFILWAAWFWTRRRWLAFWLAVLLALCCREDVAIGVAAVGVGLALCGRTRRTAWALIALGVLWFGGVKFVWMARFGPTSFSDYYALLIPRGEEGFGAVVRTLLSNPLYSLSRSLSADKLLLALQLLLPLAFLPVRQRGTLFLLVPGLIVVGLSTSQAAIGQIQFHYATHFLPYVFIATAIALAVRSRADRAVLWPPMLLGALVCTLQFGAFFAPTFKTSFHEVSFDYGPADIERRAQFDALAAQIPALATLSAGEYEGPQLARRPWLISVKQGIFDAEYVFYSRRSLRWGGAEGIRQALASGRYGLVDTRGDFALLGRGASGARNAEALRQLVGLR
jgi:uncharacterized membrane protein